MTDLPIALYGEHEEKVINQLKNCLVESAVGGALCGDAHYGYSQPVGGVVAYTDHISVSGVGYDIACVDGDTEFLSPSGWVKIKDYDGQRVMQWHENGLGNFVAPWRYIVNDDNKFYHLKTKYGIDQMVTADHDLLIYPVISDNETKAVPIRASEFVERHNTLALGMYANFETAFTINQISQCDLTDAEIRVQMMVNADAYIDGSKAIVSVKKKRKILRAEYLLQEAEIEYTKNEQSNDYTTFRFVPPLPEKTYKPFWKCTANQLRIISEESLHWDGNVDTPCFYTSKEEEADFMQFAYTATNRRAVKRSDTREDGTIEYRVFRYDKTHIGMRSSAKQNIELCQKRDEKSYCFSVPTGYWVSRRNGKVAITGNCGNKAVKTSYNISDLGHEFSEGIVGHWMDRIAEEVSFGMGRKNAARVDHPVLDKIADADFEGQRQFTKLASDQLGTVGGGNHYVDLFLDEGGWIWIGVHFGSRGFGHKTATGFLAVSQGKNFNDNPEDSGMDSYPNLLHIDTDAGQSYLSAMQLAGDYAYAGRDVVCDTVLEILGAESTFEVHNHHNFAWLENHNGQNVWVVRKGATPAFKGQLGFVGGSMGDISVILEGTQNPEDSDNFCSTVHGAGRVMSRTRAAGKMKKRWTCSNRDCDWFAGFGEHKPDPVICPTCGHTKMSKQWQKVLPGEIDFDEVQEEIRSKGIELRGAGADEAPGVYKRLPEVLEAHEGQIKILHTLTPIGVAMAGPDIKDAFRD